MSIQAAPDLSERRRHTRYAYSAAIEYENGGRKSAKAIDLSDEGICVATREPLEEGREIEIFLMNGNVSVISTVRNQEPLGHGEHRIGFGFVSSKPELVQMLIAAHNMRHD